MKKVFLMFFFCLCANTFYAQGFYSIAHAVDSLYPNDTTEDGPKAKVRRIFKRWDGQLNAQGSFSTAAQNFNNFSTNLPNYRTQNANCSNDFEPTWKEIGPAMETDNSNNLVGAGLIHKLIFHPQYNGTNNQIIYAISGFGGIWKTIDDGENWTRLNTDHDISFSSIGNLVIDPVNPNRMYVSTGSPNEAINTSYIYLQRDFPLYTLGIYGTDDGGVTWVKINNSISNNLLWGGAIYNLQIDPTNNNNLIFTSTDGIYTSTNASGSLASISWTKNALFSSSFPTDNQIVGLTFNPTSNVWFVSGLKIYSNSNPFGGGTWVNTTIAGSGLDLTSGNFPSTTDVIVRIKVVNSYLSGQNNEIYALIYAGSDKIGIAKKIGNANWTIVPYYFGACAGRSIDKQSIVAIPGTGTAPNNTDYYIGNNCYYFYQSSGSSGNLNGSYPNYPNYSGIHADIQGLYIHPSQPNKLWITSDGGISLKLRNVGAFDGGTTYKNKGIQAQLLWDFDDSEQDSQYRLAALQDNGTMYIGGVAGNVWKNAWFYGDGYGAKIYDKSATDAIVKCSADPVFQRFNYTIGSTGLSFPYGNPTQAGTAYFANPQYPNERVFLGDWNWAVTSGGGTSWHQPGYYASNSIILNFNSNTYSYAGSNPPFNKTTYQNYYGVPSPAYSITQRDKPIVSNPRPSFIIKSLNGYNYQNAWDESFFTNVSAITNALYDAAKLASAISVKDIPQLSGISCAPDDGNKVWVCSSGLLPNFKIWKSVDGGSNWTNADPFGIFSNIPVFDVLALEGSSGIVFAATLDGVYYTDNT